MSTDIWVALITAGATIITVIITNHKSRVKQVEVLSKEIEKQVSAVKQEYLVSQAVTDTKIDELTREVREHNNFAKRIPVVEDQIKFINHRLDDLEKGE